MEWLRAGHAVKSGTAFIIKPGEWHRYQPSVSKGWVEDWFEIRGRLADYWLEEDLFRERFYQLAAPARFFSIIDEAHKAVHSGEFVAEGFLESRACALVAEIGVSHRQQSSRAPRTGERALIAQARQCLSEGASIKAPARLLGVSYQSLHRSFKRLTGLSPKQFSERARLANAEGLLAGDRLSIKEIASQLGYHSASHFSLAFKRHYGVAPAVWRSRRIDAF